MNFTPVDWNTWERAEVFRHFIRDLRCVMSLTVEVDITDFLRAVKGRKRKGHCIICLNIV